MSIGDVVTAVMNGNAGYLLGMVVTLLWTISATGRRLFGSVQRLGTRIGDLEKKDVLLRRRVRQLEDVLRLEDCPVPRWDDADDEDQDDENGPPTRLTVPAIPPPPASLRRSGAR